MNEAPTVIGALRQFLPEFLRTKPALSPQQHRAIWAITHCRTEVMGGNVFDCQRCGHRHLAYHSCNHKACPQCGKEATKRWVRRELGKLVNAPYFLVTFTLPSELRSSFFGPLAKEAYDMFFAAVSGALSEKLSGKGLRAKISGFTAVLHTWTQRVEFHPHLHCLVPGAGLNAKGKPVRVKKADFLVYVKGLRAAFRQHMREQLNAKGWEADPAVWRKDWGVDIQPAGCGSAALKYLGAYVARTAISDSRIISVSETSVSFRWKDRSNGGKWETESLTGVEFVRRYLRHVLPKGLRSIRYYGFCHPAAKANRLRVQFHTGMAVSFGAESSRTPSAENGRSARTCSTCGGALKKTLRLMAAYRKRGPPSRLAQSEIQPATTMAIQAA